MQFTSIFFPLFLASTIVAHGGNGDKQVSTAGECKQMNSLNKLVTLAANTTKLEEVTKNNATKIEEIKAKASKAATKLETLQSNTTLVSACAVINAAKKEEKQCDETFTLQKFVTFAANSTAVAAKTNNNATKAEQIQAEASKAATKLNKLTSNSTVQAACPAVQTKNECKTMNGLQKLVDTANIQTKLDKASTGNTTKADAIKAKAAKAQPKLMEMMNNKTLMDACAKLMASATTSSSGAVNRIPRTETHSRD